MKKHYANLMLMVSIITTSGAPSHRLIPLPGPKPPFKILTLIGKILCGIKCMPLCLLLFISTCAFSQLLQLERTWTALERNGVLDRPKTMAVQNSGDHYAVVYNHERTFDVVLYDRTTEVIWRKSFSREGEKSPPKREAIAVAFSALADGVFVLIREEHGDGSGNGRIIKYDMSRERREIWHTGIYKRDYHPEVLLAASNGDAIVAGWDIDPTDRGPATDHGRSPMYVARYNAWGGRKHGPLCLFTLGPPLPRRSPSHNRLIII